MTDRDPLENIGYVSLKDHEVKIIGDFVIDPDILLPVELPPDRKNWNADSISWEAIISAMLQILAHEPAHEHAEYYRRFTLAVKPAIKEEFTEAGILKARNKDFDIAIDIFRALEGLFPDCLRTKLNSAFVYEEKARYYAGLEQAGFEKLVDETFKQAYEAYKRAINLDPQNPDSHFNFACFYFEQNNFARAKEHLEIFLKYTQDPKRIAKAKDLIGRIESSDLMDNLFREAFDAIKMGREAEGIEKIKTFLKTHQDVWNAWFLSGWGYRRLGQYARGKEAFQRALELNSDHPDTLNELAICLMELDEIDESYRTLVKALRLEPDNTKIISNLGIVSLKRGDKKEAESFFKSVLSQNADDPLARRYLEQLSSDAG